MRRFAITPDRLVEGRVVFDALESRHLARVLRLRPGDTVVASDGAGGQYTVRLDTAGELATGTVLGVASGVPESPLSVTLVQGLAKGDKMDAIVRAATELGVARVVPALAARSVARPAGGRAEARTGRWQRVAREAAKQCGRAVVPSIAVPAALDDCLQVAGEVELALCLFEGTALPLARLLAEVPAPRRAAILVGPEGGLDPQEVGRAAALGWRVVSLGQRVLRTETAGPAVLAILQSRYGDLGTR